MFTNRKPDKRIKTENAYRPFSSENVISLARASHQGIGNNSKKINNIYIYCSHVSMTTEAMRGSTGATAYPSLPSTRKPFHIGRELIEIHFIRFASPCQCM